MFQLFNSFQGELPENKLFELLSAVNEGKMTLYKAGLEATNFKKLTLIKERFLDLTDTEDWDAATAKYPKYTTDERLKDFVPLFEMSATSCKSMLKICNCDRFTHRNFKINFSNMKT